MRMLILAIAAGLLAACTTMPQPYYPPNAPPPPPPPGPGPGI